MAPKTKQVRTRRCQSPRTNSSSPVESSGIRKTKKVVIKSGLSCASLVKQSRDYESLFDHASQESVTTSRHSGAEGLSSSTWSTSPELSTRPNAISIDAKDDPKTLMAQIYVELHLASVSAGVPLSTLLKTETQRESTSTAQTASRLSANAMAMLDVIGMHLERLTIFHADKTLDAAAISHDLDAYSPGDPMTMSADVSSDPNNAAKVAQLAAIKARTSQRFGAFATSHGWMMLSILAHSATFRHSCNALSFEAWFLLSTTIEHNASSIEIFAKLRNLDWETALKHIEKQRPSTLTLDIETALHASMQLTQGSPHSYVVSEKCGRPRHPSFEGSEQIDVPNNLYYRRNFIGSKMPETWPAGRAYPSNPTTRLLAEGPCSSCFANLPCHCDPAICAIVTRPLVEVRDYGIKGVGIRALQRIRKGDILGEYVGLLLPAGDNSDPVYAFDFARSGHSPDEVQAVISAKDYGNWTRFLNHSCRPSTRFNRMIIGRRHRIMVQAERDIEMFEEITVGYGRGYWTTRHCLCGEDNCCNPGK